ncbi:DNA methyltransferase [Nostoc sp. TCL26-01]|uniref:DNA methyltransferase n=1 Tax=Nostoc sp. TCL26-01 TaxID=2576904 RepID=UPI0015BFE55D|nr:DNA methyltransferase [Nostoc sp. TCL26-01]QLE54915.1 DNA methyltransferase [Nostoc sp. TCL26-01]
MLSIVKQKSEYTFKANRNLGRHAWLRLTPAYGVKLVEKLITSVAEEAVILDPFSGTATTGLVAAEKGYRAIAFDINPFLIWLGNVKCNNYSQNHLTDLYTGVEKALEEYKCLTQQKHWTPQIFNIERWWSTNTLNFIAGLRAALVHQFGEPTEDSIYNLVWVAFCRLVIETSSAAFNHVSMSFNDTKNNFEIDYIPELFLSIFDFILKTAATRIAGSAQFIEMDARHITTLDNIKINKVITSPPYPNRISYIRELRPYMYWTKFLHEAKEAGELDWLAVGGTWGIATSRLLSWQMQEENLPQEVFSVVDKIKCSDGKNAQLLSIYVLKYFHDMHLHLSSLRSILHNDAELNYIVGNSTFFGNMVDTASLMIASMHILGYSDINLEIIRKRNCNKALYEYCISAKWFGS